MQTVWKKDRNRQVKAQMVDKIRQVGSKYETRVTSVERSREILGREVLHVNSKEAEQAPRQTQNPSFEG